MLTEYLPLAEARAETSQFLGALLADQAGPGQTSNSAATILAGLGTQATPTWVARVDGQVVAVVGARLCHPTPADPEYTYMPAHYAIVTLSTWHVAGPDAWVYIPDLLAHVGADARAGGIDRLSFEVPADSPGVAALLGAGFVPDVVLAASPVNPDDPGPVALPEGVQIRPATAGDAPAILELTTEEVRYHAENTRSGIRPDQDPVPSRTIIDGWLQNQEGGGLPTLVAETGGRVVAVAPLLWLDDGDEAEFGLGLPVSYGYIGSTVVTAAARGRGIATALVHGLFEAARARGIRLILLHYIADNILAAPFWVARGFTPVTVTLTMHELGSTEAISVTTEQDQHDR